MVNIKKLFAVCICTLLGGIALGNKNCFAHNLEFHFNTNNYRINCENKFKLNRDYSLVSTKIFDYIKSSKLMGDHRTIELDEDDFENFKLVFVPLKEELFYIDRHSDYNSDDYVPFTSEIENSLNEKYINFFRFIKEHIS